MFLMRARICAGGESLPIIAGASMHIVRLDSLGVSIALLLSRCGIGTITTADDTSVTAIDHPVLSNAMIIIPKCMLLGIGGFAR